MTDLSALIQVRKHAVEEKQKFLAELYRQAEELQMQKQNLLDQLQQETITVQKMNDIQALNDLALYSMSVKKKVSEIENSWQKLEIRIEASREDMREAFADLKKIEITQERREEEEALEQLKKEMDELDEIGLQLFRRNQQED